jgi:CRP/FNR family transcriptional regulator, cyclic AMP receptor protein
MHGQDEIRRWLARSYLFEGMNADDLNLLARTATTRTMRRGEYLFDINDPAEEIYVVGTGEVMDRVVDVDGHEVVHFVHGPGMTFGEPGYFSIERLRIVAVLAVQPTVVVRLDRRDLDPFMARHSGIKDRVLEALASNTRWQTTMIAALATRPLTDRLLLRILELVDSQSAVPGEPKSTSPITQSMLAAMIGVSRENVNRALSALALDGVLRQVDGRYVVVNEDQLRLEAGQGMPIVARRDRRSAVRDS